MNLKRYITVVLAAGLAGGVLSKYLVLPTVYAQAQATAPQIVPLGQRMPILNDAGAKIAEFYFDSRDGRPTLKYFGDKIPYTLRITRTATGGVALEPESPRANSK